jgi:hypothetical protein
MKGVKAMNPVKSVIVVFVLFAISVEMQAQADTVRNPEQFLFPEFYVGVAKMLNGEKIVLDLNYNIVTEKMVFMQKGQIFDIVNQSLIDTVYLEGKKFIPNEKVFYEILVNGGASFFIQHKGSVKRPPRPAAYGGTSEVSSSTYISNLRLGNDRYRMPKNAEIIIVPGSLYWIRINNEMFMVTGKKSLLKIFADSKNDVKQFMGRSKFNAEDPEQICKLVNYYNALP